MTFSLAIHLQQHINKWCVRTHRQTYQHFYICVYFCRVYNATLVHILLVIIYYMEKMFLDFFSLMYVVMMCVCISVPAGD